MSLIYLPLMMKDQVLGVISIQSIKKNAYTDYHLNILQNLASYTTIALDNADAYKKLNATLDNLKAMQDQLVTQEKLASLGALTAGIAHEIKNPLNFVNNFAELSIELVQELKQDLAAYAGEFQNGDSNDIADLLSDLEQNAKKINEHGKRADSIVRSMLQHSRGKAGEHQATDINAVLDEYLNLAYHGMRAQNTDFNVAIEKELDDSIGEIMVVPQDISRVFLNIISNGFYETHKKKLQSAENGFAPAVRVTSKNLGANVEIRIRDNGNGIPESIRDQLFNPFFTTKPTGEGTGLGLSISYDIIVQEHRGDIYFNTREGEFTEFVITLPKQ
jgi:signal transduction histidine kinase